MMFCSSKITIAVMLSLCFVTEASECTICAAKNNVGKEYKLDLHLEAIDRLQRANDNINRRGNKQQAFALNASQIKCNKEFISTTLNCLAKHQAENMKSPWSSAYQKQNKYSERSFCPVCRRWEPTKMNVEFNKSIHEAEMRRMSWERASQIATLRKKYPNLGKIIFEHPKLKEMCSNRSFLQKCMDNQKWTGAKL